MNSSEGEFRMEFPTQAEANAFVLGIEYFDDDHTSTEGPDEEVGPDGEPTFVVIVRRFA